MTSALQDNLANKTQASLQLLYLKNEETVTQGLLRHGGPDSRRLAKYCIRDKVAAVVKEVTPEGLHVTVKRGNL